MGGGAFGGKGNGEVGREVRGQALDNPDQPKDFLLAQGVDLVVEELDFQFRFYIDPIVVFRVPAIDLGLAVLAHHDDRRGIGGLEGEDQV